VFPSKTFVEKPANDGSLLDGLYRLGDNLLDLRVDILDKRRGAEELLGFFGFVTTFTNGPLRAPD
jgi:hypothetical protein